MLSPKPANLAAAVRAAAAEKRLILMDGAMGTELLHFGLDPRRHASAEWNLTHEDTVAAIHEDFINAGAQCLLTNSFVAHLQPSHERQRVCLAAAEHLARTAAGPDRWVLGSLGPPLSDLPEDLLAVVAAGMALDAVDALLLETQTDLVAAAAIVDQWQAQEVARPMIVSFVFNATGSTATPFALPRRHEGTPVTPAMVAAWAATVSPPLLALGVNCGQGMALLEYLGVLHEMREETALPFLLRPEGTGGIVSRTKGIRSLLEADADATLQTLVDVGVVLLGGCCGTTPADIAAVHAGLRQNGLAWPIDGAQDSGGFASGHADHD